MLNKGKIFWYIWAGILVLLLLMSSTDLTIKEKKIEVYPISVIIEGDDDDYYVSFKEGADQATMEFHGDASLIILYADYDQAQQIELVKREIRDGARVVTLVLVKPEETVRKLEGINPSCPVILLDRSPDEGTALDTIGVNGREIGGLLREAAASQVPGNVPVYLFCGGLDYGDSAWIYEGARTVLDGQGYHYRLTERKNQDTYRQVVQKVDASGGNGVIIVALDVQSPDQATRIPEENTIYQDRVVGLYGTGNTTSLLRALDRRVVTGLTACNQLGEGYLNIKQVVETIQGTHQKQNTALKAIYMDKDKLRDEAYEKMLYPIE